MLEPERYAAAVQVIQAQRGAKRMRILAGLGLLSRLGGPKARRVVHRLAEDITANSGNWPAYRTGD